MASRARTEGARSPIPSSRAEAVPVADTWRVVRLSRGLGEHAARWDELNDRLFNRHPMLCSEFIDGLLRHFGDGTEHLCFHESEGSDCAMCLLKPKGMCLWTTFLPSQAQLCTLLALEPTPAQSLLRSLPGFAIALDLLCVDPAYHGVTTGNRPMMELHHLTTMSIALNGSFEAYWATRTTHLQQNMRRYETRVKAAGLDAEYRIVTGPEQMASAVRRYGELESAGWKGRIGTAVATGSVQSAFYSELMIALAARGEAAVHELWFGDALAASRLIIHAGRSLVMLKTAYDESLANYSPGRLLLRRVLGHAFERFPGRTAEFYTDATQDQLAWATNSRSIKHLQFYRGWAAAASVKAGHLLRRLDSRAGTGSRSGVSVESYRHPDDLPRQACALFERAAQTYGVQASLDWYRTLVQEVFNDGSDVRFFVLQHDAKPVAVLPMVANARSPRQVQALHNFYTSLYAPPIASWLKGTDMVPLIRAMQAHWPGASAFILDPMDPHSAEFQVLRAAFEACGLIAFRFFRFGNWTLSCQGVAWRAYLAARHGSVRSTISRMTKKLNAAGGRLEVITGGDRLDAGIAAYEQVYASSWKQSEPYPGFVPALIRASVARGWIRLGLAWLNDRPIAAQIWLVSHGRAEIFKLAYDEGFKGYSAGTLLTAQLMMTVLDQDHAREVDYLAGDDSHKKLWMTDRRERWGLVAYSPTTWRGIAGLIHECAGRLVKASGRPKHADSV